MNNSLGILEGECIDNFRLDNRITARTEAIRRLIDEALRKYEKKEEK